MTLVGSSLSPAMQFADELITRELSQIGTSYGQLVYLAGLLDPNSGRYNHFGISAEFSDLDASQLWRRRHEDVFQEWVGMPLQRKMCEVESYITGLAGVDRSELIDAWLRLTPYKNLVPASIQGPERQKHVSDFEAILGLLKNVYGVASPDPNA